MSESRTSKSVKNIAVSLFSYFAGVILTLYSKKVFLDALGADTLGLQSTISGFLGTLSLAELGLGVAIGASMYRHLEDRNHEAISEIISIQGWFYRRVAVFLVVCTALFMLFSSELFKHESLPTWYIYATMVSFLWSSIAGYLFNYLLFREGLHRPVSEYWLSFLKFPIISALSAVIASYVYTSFALEHYSISEIVLHGGIFAIVFSLALGGCLLCCLSGISQSCLPYSRSCLQTF